MFRSSSRSSSSVTAFVQSTGDKNLHRASFSYGINYVERGENAQNHARSDPFSALLGLGLELGGRGQTEVKSDGSIIDLHKRHFSG